MKYFGALSALFVISSAQAAVGRYPSSEGAVWGVDPREPGPDVPLSGRSLFDHLTATGAKGELEIPYPFSALIEKFSAEASFKSVLIPLGRSLQRTAADPDYFVIPRVVTVADGDRPSSDSSRQSKHLKDRLYMGFHEKAGVIEVISYNEAAGRFEFQVVKNYKPGQKPQVFYASRALCITCHQGLSPIFSRQLWDETNGNEAISKKLSEAMPGLMSYQSVPLSQGISVPYEIDNATDRANLLSFYQKIWTEGCGAAASSGISPARCRGILFKLALQYRLSGDDQLDAQSPEAKDLSEKVLQGLRQDLWPQGIAIPNPDIPNRNPLEKREGPTFAFNALPSEESVKTALSDVLKNSGIPAEYEPLNPRSPLEVWRIQSGDPAFFNKAILGIAEMISDEDIRVLDAKLKAGSSSQAKSIFRSSCSMRAGAGDPFSRRLYLECGGVTEATANALWIQGNFKVREGIIKDATFARIAFRDSGENCRLEPAGSMDDLKQNPCGEAHSVAVSGRYMPGEVVLSAKQSITGLQARRLNGDSIEDIRLTWKGENFEEAQIEIRLNSESQTLNMALETLIVKSEGDSREALAQGPFRRARVLTSLEKEMGSLRTPWDARTILTPIVVDKIDGAGTQPDSTSGEKILSQRCMSCHGSDRSPPSNFLYAQDGKSVSDGIGLCAERIAYRLLMWGQPQASRKKTPMPPLPVLRMSEKEWKNSADYKSLQAFVVDVLKSKGIDEAEFLKLDFESLPRCAP